MSKKYECNICGKAFEKFSNKKDHQKTCGTVRLSRFEELEGVENLRTLSPERSSSKTETK